MMSCPIFNVHHFPEWADEIANEIVNAKKVDPVWHDPSGWRVDEAGSYSRDKKYENNKGVFDDVKLHFVNRNFNIIYEESTVQLALSGYEYNPLFEKSKQLFEIAREFNHETGPFGRMIVWDVPPRGHILKHVDNLPYQTNVTRYIFTASRQSTPDIGIRINEYEVDAKPGMMFAFHAEDAHEFINYSDDYWYFLGIDYWIPEKLENAIKKYKITKDTILDYEPMGLKNLKCKYWTRH